jgi:putative DNA primase/helicase
MPGNKDFCILLKGQLLVELGEMHAFSRAEVTAVKTAVSRRVDTYRAPYGKLAEDHPRQGSLIGTTNQFEWAQDPTGGRRFWPIRCKEIDLGWLVANRSQLFAEAVRDVKAGLPWYIMPPWTGAEQEARYQVDLWEEAIQEWIAKTGKTEASSLEILQQACNRDIGVASKGDASRLETTMRRLGWARWRSNQTRGWRKQ